MKGVKTLRYVEPFTNDPKNKKRKFCATCANIATQIACFDVGEATVIERYCDTCVKTIGQSPDTGDPSRKSM
jgi:hypothetical protein